MDETLSGADAPVVVIGAGPSGLGACLFLADQGIDTIAIERRDGPSRLPKAHAIHQRLMEVYRHHGLAESIYAAELPLEDRSTIHWITSWGGDGPLDRRTVHITDVFGGGATQPIYDAISPCSTANVAQCDLEPVMLDAVRQRGRTRIAFGHQVTGLEQSPTHVTTSLVETATGVTSELRARYVIAADGGNTIGRQLGIPMLGLSNLAQMLSIHFKADLSQWDSSKSLMTAFIGPEFDGPWDRGLLVRFAGHDGDKYEWVFHFALPPGQEITDDAALLHMRKVIKLPDLRVDVLRVSRWVADAVVAERFRDGRVFLVGDAAHRMPPTGGFGMNSAILDSHNLSWKLAAVLNGHAAESLLDTYAVERQPVALANVESAALNTQSHMLVDPVIGLMPGNTAGNEMALGMLLSDTDSGHRRRARLAKVMEIIDCEYQARDLDLGYRYASAAVIDDQSEPPVNDPLGCHFSPSAHPGRRLPHAWLHRGGNRVSTLDLVAAVGFTVVLVGDDLTGVAGLAGTLSRSSVGPITVARLESNAFEDPRDVGLFTGDLAAAALLIRPDGHVGWRGPLTPALDDVLCQAITQVTGRATVEHALGSVHV